MDITTTYDTSVSEISYSDDVEFRAAIRRVFSMKPLLPSNDDDEMMLDPVTADELDYDVDAASIVMDDVFDKTSTDPLFQELYDHAAAKMMSLDRTIGMAVLFAYDNFAHYHRCLCVFFREPSTWNRGHPAFLSMLEKIR